MHPNFHNPPNSHSPWRDGVTEAISPLPLCTEEGKVKLEAWDSDVWVVHGQPGHGLGQAAQCVVGKLRTRVTQEPRIKLYSQTTPYQRGWRDHWAQLFPSLATLRVTSFENISMLRLHPRDSEVTGVRLVWTLVVFKVFSGTVCGRTISGENH